MQGGGRYRYIYGDPRRPQLVTATRAPDGTLTTYDYGEDDLLFSLERGGQRYYVATDQVGTPRVVADAAGTVVKRLDYDAFGVPVSDSAPAFDLPIGYAGGIADPVTGLVRFGFRDYDPAAGRWTARDPIVQAGGANTYAYVNSDPVGIARPVRPRGLVHQRRQRGARLLQLRQHAGPASTSVETVAGDTGDRRRRRHARLGHRQGQHGHGAGRRLHQAQGGQRRAHEAGAGRGDPQGLPEVHQEDHAGPAHADGAGRARRSTRAWSTRSTSATRARSTTARSARCGRSSGDPARADRRSSSSPPGSSPPSA